MVATQSRPFATQAPADLMSAEEFFMLPDDEPCELVDGKVIELMPPGLQHGELAGDIYVALKGFVRKNDLGRCFVESGFILQLNPDTVRSPDVSFVEKSRLPDGKAPRTFFRGAPDLAVEIVSPGDLWSEVEDKIQEYLEGGTQVIWVFDPASQTVHTRTANETAIYKRADTLPGGEVLPGFELKLTEIFEDQS